MLENVISAEIEPKPGQATQAALAIQRLGFRVLHIGRTISVQAPQPLWKSTFNISFQPQKKTVIAELAGKGEVVYPKALTEDIHIPSDLEDLVADVMIVEPPEFY